MGFPSKGKADYLALGDYNAVCYQCGRKFKASTLKRHWQGYYVCPEHWEPRQPQDFARAVPENITPPWTQPMPADDFTSNNYYDGLTTYNTNDTVLCVGVTYYSQQDSNTGNYPTTSPTWWATTPAP